VHFPQIVYHCIPLYTEQVKGYTHGIPLYTAQVKVSPQECCQRATGVCLLCNTFWGSIRGSGGYAAITEHNKKFSHNFLEGVKGSHQSKSRRSSQRATERPSFSLGRHGYLKNEDGPCTVNTEALRIYLNLWGVVHLQGTPERNTLGRTTQTSCQ
jgi:hypothetical protein